MIKNKLVVIALVGMLAMCVGLTACGGSSASSSAASSSAASSAAASSAAASSEATSSSSTSSSDESSEIAYWTGTLEDGQVVIYSADWLNGVAALCIAKSDFSDGAVWYGESHIDENGVVTITDAETNHKISFTLGGDTATSLVINIENYGEAELKSVTEDEFKALVKDFLATPEGKKLKKEIKREVKQLEKKVAKKAQKLKEEMSELEDGTIIYWDGKLDNGMRVSYLNNPEKNKAFLAVTKKDLSDGAVWYGKYTTSEDGKVMTITDSETGQTMAYEVVETEPGAAMKITLTGVGEANLKPVTKEDFIEFADKLSALTDKSGEAK